MKSNFDDLAASLCYIALTMRGGYDEIVEITTGTDHSRTCFSIILINNL